MDEFTEDGLLKCTEDLIQITISDEEDITNEELDMLNKIFERKAATLGIKDFEIGNWTIYLNCKLD